MRSYYDSLVGIKKFLFVGNLNLNTFELNLRKFFKSKKFLHYLLSDDNSMNTFRNDVSAMCQYVVYLLRLLMKGKLQYIYVYRYYYMFMYHAFTVKQFKLGRKEGVRQPCH